jgi:hypothetical protein
MGLAALALDELVDGRFEIGHFYRLNGCGLEFSQFSSGTR